MVQAQARSRLLQGTVGGELLKGRLVSAGALCSDSAHQAERIEASGVVTMHVTPGGHLQAALGSRGVVKREDWMLADTCCFYGSVRTTHLASQNTVNLNVHTELVSCFDSCVFVIYFI